MPNHSKQSLRGEALRRRVLETALELFSEHGYFNTSIHDIRRVAGVSIGAIYHHFKNKEALARSLYESLLQQMDDAITEVCAGQQGCLSQSRAIIEELFDLTMQQPRSMQFVLLAQHREYLPDEAPICSSGPFQAMKQVVVKGIEEGEVRKMEPWVAATAMFGGALRMMNLQLDGVLDKPLPAYVDEVVECAWYAIRR
jgi:TetR/AcrR family transcriptional regulator, repressor of fatR-cypB operon